MMVVAGGHAASFGLESVDLLGACLHLPLLQVTQSLTLEMLLMNYLVLHFSVLPILIRLNHVGLRLSVSWAVVLCSLGLLFHLGSGLRDSSL